MIRLRMFKSKFENVKYFISFKGDVNERTVFNLLIRYGFIRQYVFYNFT